MQLRITYQSGETRLVQASELITQVRSLPRDRPSHVGPVAVAMLDGLGETRWEAYCSSREALSALAAQLEAELRLEGHERHGRTGRERA